MPKITIDDLDKIKRRVESIQRLREGGPYKAKIVVHMGTCGIAAGARKVLSALLKAIEEKNIKDVMVTTSGCAGLCSSEPMMTVEIQGETPVKYIKLDEEKVNRILEEHILGGRPVKEYALAIGSERMG